MGDIIFQKGTIWYVNHTHKWHDGTKYQSHLIRRSLKTTDKDLAIKRFIALLNSVENGTYQYHSMKFDTLMAKYDPQVDRENKLMNVRNHLMPVFKGKRLTEINIQEWAQSVANEYVRSTALQIMRPAGEMGLTIDYRAIKFKEGRKFDGTQILTEEIALNVLARLKAGPRSKKYYSICHVALYSTMPLSDLLHLTKAQVVFIGQDAGITYSRRKTLHKNKPPIFIPMTNKLQEAFRGIPIPINDDGRWFPPMNTSTVSSIVGRALKAEGWKHGGAFHVFRHFGACYLVREGVPLTTIRELMGHSDFNTTLIYARTDRQTLKEGVKKFDVK